VRNSAAQLRGTPLAYSATVAGAHADRSRLHRWYQGVNRRINRHAATRRSSLRCDRQTLYHSHLPHRRYQPSLSSFLYLARNERHFRLAAPSRILRIRGARKWTTAIPLLCCSALTAENRS
jgi:hypothetical protein